MTRKMDESRDLLHEHRAREILNDYRADLLAAMTGLEKTVLFIQEGMSAGGVPRDIMEAAVCNELREVMNVTRERRLSGQRGKRAKPLQFIDWIISKWSFERGIV